MSSNDFTTRELQLMSLAWQCFDGEPKVNYQKLADMAGMTNPVSASNAWAKIKKKLAAQAGNATSGDADGAATEGPKSPEKAKRTPGKRKKKGEAERNEEESPTKKAKASPKGMGGVGRKKKGEVEDGLDGEEDGEDGQGGIKVKGEDVEGDFFT